MLSKEAIQETLKAFIDSYLGIDLLAAKVLKTITIQDNVVTIVLKFGYPLNEYLPILKETITHVLQPLLGNARLELIIDWKVNQHVAQNNLKPVTGIKNIIAVASGKGGVGKSTVAVNLALAIEKEGAKVGILDADIYGPSQPYLLGIYEKPVVGENKKLIPILKYGLQTMSMGYLIEENSPMVWRGPMVSSALQQLLYETAWEELDYLIVDLPPGTGDIQLTLAQKIPVNGAVIVTTPQNVALLDAKKALAMFQKLDIAILGIVENMSTHICGHCGHQEAIFGSGGGEKMAAQFKVPLLGQLPLDLKTQIQADQGHPIVIADPQGKIANLYQEIARHVTARLSLLPRTPHIAVSSVVTS